MNEDLNELLAWLQQQATDPVRLQPHNGGTYEQGYRYAYISAALRVRMLIEKHFRCEACGGELDPDDMECGTCNSYVSPEEQRRQDAMERGDYLRDCAKDERAERKHHERPNH